MKVSKGKKSENNMLLPSDQLSKYLVFYLLSGLEICFNQSLRIMVLNYPNS